jgi:creatinine amidohydrolase/Fe(II)-dependent formamide hydrolase-like protein
MKTAKLIAAIAIVAAATTVWAQDAAAPPAQAPRPGRGRGRGPSPVLTMKRPIEMRDTVWIEDMTLLEVRDSLAAGKTTAMIFAGGMEDNGPYIAVSQHDSTVKGMCDVIARKLGNALCAPIAALAPANPEKASSPGSVSITAETFKAVLMDEATSLKSEGFKNILFMVDHGSDAKPAEEAAKELAAKWEGSGTAAYYISEYYNDKALVKFEEDELGVHEKTDGVHYHDDYPYAVVSLVINPEDVRMPERKKVNLTTVNGYDLATPKAVSDGKRLMEFRANNTVAAIQKLIPPK